MTGAASVKDPKLPQNENSRSGLNGSIHVTLDVWSVIRCNKLSFVWFTIIVHFASSLWITNQASPWFMSTKSCCKKARKLNEFPNPPGMVAQHQELMQLSKSFLDQFQTLKAKSGTSNLSIGAIPSTCFSCHFPTYPQLSTIIHYQLHPDDTFWK